MTSSDPAPNEQHPPGKDHHAQEHAVPPIREVAEQVPPLTPQWLKDLLNRRGDGEGDGNDWYERMRVRSLPQEEKQNEKDQDHDLDRGR